MSLTNTGDLWHSKKDKAVLAELQAEKDARDAAATANSETFSTTSTLAPSTAAAESGVGHSETDHKSREHLSLGQKLGHKLGFGTAKKEQGESIAAERRGLDETNQVEKEELRREVQERPMGVNAGISGGRGALGGTGAGFGP